ncbi:MAG: hypothetical protein R3C45_15605 [Phycisphaerales bacterium]
MRITQLTKKAEEEAIEAVARPGTRRGALQERTMRVGTDQQGRVQAANIKVVAWAGSARRASPDRSPST